MLKRKQSSQNKNGKTVLPEEPAYIIAIGASAGGLEAIHEFFDNMPEAGNFSCVVIQHLSPAHKSLLVELVARHTRMNVVEAGHNVKLEKSSVYIIPNNKMMTVKAGKVQLVQKSDHIPNTAIDAFLYSLARDKGRQAIAVILSGTGSDGTRGAEAIRQAGGMVLVQSPDTAKFDGMPNNAINAGVADFVLPPAKMPERIAQYIEKFKGHSHNRSVYSTQEQLLQEIMELIKIHTGQDFRSYKPATIMRRIEKRMTKLELSSPEEYVTYLSQHPEESETLYKNFLIGVTRFFRDKQAFKVLETQVLPDLVKGKQPGTQLKIWVNACSTGEEAYSIAMVFDRYIKQHNLSLDIKLFATDLDEAAIDYAGKGLYPLSIEKDIDKSILEDYFVREGRKYAIAPHIRKRVVFARHNVLKDPPFIHNDFISCRNMLIYMDSSLQGRVIDTLDFSLYAGGYLFLGPSEHLSLLKENFVEVDGKWKLFRKVGVRRRTRSEPTYNPTGDYRKYDALKSAYMLSRAERRQDNLTLVEAFKDLLADEFGYAALYIDHKYEVKEAVGNFTRYLSLPEHKLNFHLLKMLLPELSIPVNAAVRKAWKEQKKTVVRAVRIKRNDRVYLINAVVKPLPPEKLPYTLVVIWETEDAAAETVDTARHHLSHDNQSLILELEDELQETRTNLQMAVESLETANEELQSSNEELLSANEELQSSNEELQSLNEELHTLNTEHQLKIRELIELNDDLNNYFSSTDIGQVFVDGDMRIRKFNPAAVKLINLIESDIGRPIDHISNNIEHSTLVADIKRILKTKSMVEKEIYLSNGVSGLMRIFPYVRSDKKIDGAVISFIDISVIKNLDNIITGIFNSTPNAIIAFRAERNADNAIIDFRVQTANKSADILLEKAAQPVIGLSLKNDLSHLSNNAFFDRLVKLVNDDNVFHGEYTFTRGPQPIIYELIAVKMMDGVMITYADITEKKDAEQRLRRSYSELVVAKDTLKQLNQELEGKALDTIEQKEFLADSIPMLVWTASPEGKLEFVNQQFPVYTGIAEEELLAQGLEVCMHPNDVESYRQAWQKTLEQRRELNMELLMRRHDGDYRWQQLQVKPMMSDQHELTLWVGTILEIHERRVATEVLEYRVKERTEELERINRELELSNVELQQYAFVASHDLKEPTRKIFIFANMIRDTYLQEKDSRAADLVNRIINSSQRMMRLIEDLLNYSKLSQHGVPELIDLGITIREILSDLEVVINEKKAVVEVGELCPVYGVPGQIRQVFQNLISNALKFTRKEVPPHVVINAYTVGEKDVEAKADYTGGFCRIEIRDNGIGFDERFLDKIFTLFQRLHTHDQYEGTGIGLAITRKIVEKHHGIITARSEEGKGTTFIIILPLRQVG